MVSVICALGSADGGKSSDQERDDALDFSLPAHLQPDEDDDGDRE